MTFRLKLRIIILHLEGNTSRGITVYSPASAGAHFARFGGMARLS